MPFSSKISINASKFTADVIPNAVNWNNVVSNGNAQWTTTQQQITGTNVPILLTVVYNDDVQLHYRILAAPAGFNQFLAPNQQGYIWAAANDAFYVPVNWYVYFAVQTAGANAQNQITVFNTSNNNTQLDQFLATVQ